MVVLLETFEFKRASASRRVEESKRVGSAGKGLRGHSPSWENGSLPRCDLSHVAKHNKLRGKGRRTEACTDAVIAQALQNLVHTSKTEKKSEICALRSESSPGRGPKPMQTLQYAS